jgi:hypothetical protein
MLHKIKRISARSYMVENYYIVYIPETKMWNVGYRDSNGDAHIEDFQRYRCARDYALRQANKVGA